MNFLLDPSSVHATFIFALGYSVELGHVTQRPYCHLENSHMGPYAEQWLISHDVGKDVYVLSGDKFNIEV